MLNAQNTIRNILTKRQGLRVLAFVFIAFGVTLFALYAVQTMKIHESTTSYQTATTTFTSSLVAPRVTPRTLSIPSISVRAQFESPLGLDEVGASEVPEGYDAVGWYKYGPTPGELGPAVVLGHVDSVDGPAVFYSLGQLQIGDEVEIERDDGSTVLFAITGLERIEQDTFPIDRVYGDIDHAGLRLITCSGVYDKGTKRYSHNLIVYATLRDILYPINIDTP